MRILRRAAVLAAGVLSILVVAVPSGAEPPAALRACTTGDYPPYSMSDGAGGFRGVDIDLARGFADVVHRPIEFVPTTWKAMATDFGARGCDLAVGGVSDSPARRAFSDFSIGYGTDGKAPRETNIFVADWVGPR